MGLCRHYAQMLLKSATTMDPEEIKHKQMLMRCGRETCAAYGSRSDATLPRTTDARVADAFFSHKRCVFSLVLARRRLRGRGQFLPAASFHSRKVFFIAKDTGALQQKATSRVSSNRPKMSKEEEASRVRARGKRVCEVSFFSLETERTLAESHTRVGRPRQLSSRERDARASSFDERRFWAHSRVSRGAPSRRRKNT